MPIENAIASLPVKDVKAAAGWYQRLLQRPPDSTPMPEIVEFKFPRGGWLQVYQLPERAGQGSVTLSVTDLAGVIAHVESMGVDTSERPSGSSVRTMMITDPDGNHIAFAEATDQSMAR